MLGSLDCSERAAIDGIPTPPKTNPDSQGTPIPQWLMTKEVPYSYNINHQRADVTANYDAGKMDGFVTRYEQTNPPDKRIPMGSYGDDRVPVLHALAKRFTVCDRWFCSMLSSTWPNRKYFHSGQRDSDDDTQMLPPFPGFRTTPLYEALEAAKGQDGKPLTWRCYFSDLPFLAFWYRFAFTHRRNFSSVVQFVEDCAAGTLPSVSIIDPPYTLADDHPPHNPTLGEKFIGLVVDALTTSQSWDDTLLLLLYDENGGFYDHVPPPAPAVRNSRNDAPLGFRVPALLISPYTARGETSSTVYDHTSFMKSLSTHWHIDFPTQTFGERWTGANDFWAAVHTNNLLARGIYTGVQRHDVVASLDWGTGVYERLQDELTKFEALLERLFVIPELKGLDRRALVFDDLTQFENKVVVQKRMIDHQGGS